MEAKKLRTVQGKLLTKAGMLREIAAAEEDYHYGNYNSHEQLKEEIKDWKK